MLFIYSHFNKFMNCTLPASFTIEASVIIPLTFIIIAWLITTSFNIHDNVCSFTDAIFQIIENAPDKADGSAAAYDGLIDTEYLDGRATLLKYKLLKDGLLHLSGGIEDED